MERDFKGIWIQKEIWLNPDLKIMEKLFLVEIDSLDNEKGCWASNKYFSEFFGISKGRCTQIIKSLEEKKFITIKLKRKGKEIVKRTLRVVNKLSTPSEYIKQPYLENDEENNTTVKSIDIRKGDFKKSLSPFLEKYGKDLLNKFYLYWTEKNAKGRKMRFEMEKVFDVSRRLITWKSRDEKFKGNDAEETEEFKAEDYN